MNRLDAILDLARRDGKVAVEDLAAKFDVSAQTIRKDLNALARRRLLARVHGGAVIASGVENISYEARRLLAADAKEAIGRAAADLVPDGTSMILDIGTTTEAVARALLQHRDLLVVTNNLNVAMEMRPYPGIEVAIAGGTVRRADGGVIGEATIDFIRQYRVDVAVLGVSGVDADGMLLDYDYREVRVAQAIMAASRSVIVVADAGKFTRHAPVRLAGLDAIDTLVTDRAPAGIRRLCRDAGVRLIEAFARPAAG